MKRFLLPGDRPAFKANLHCHSTFSDGRNTVEQLKQLYMERGYSVVAFSDHNCLVPHPELAEPGFVPLTATEINIDDGRGHTYHLNFFSPELMRDRFPDIDRVYSVEGVNRVIETGNAAGYLCQYNHPRWSFQNASDFTGLRGLWGFEVFNTGCEVEMNDGWGDYEYETMCRDSDELPAATATDDNHNWAQDPGGPYDDSFKGWTTFFAPELTYAAVFEALKNKDCYATTGPEITALYAEDGKLYVDHTPACSVILRFDTRRTGRVLSLHDDITHSEFDIGGDYRHFRLEVKDIHGNKALTRAYTKDDIE
ncbi:MAG: hypothetical protein J5584_06665 [Clostridia bacterium]|nr:hypothetical protein [Clostridia bacterium]